MLSFAVTSANGSVERLPVMVEKLVIAGWTGIPVGKMVAALSDTSLDVVYALPDERQASLEEEKRLVLLGIIFLALGVFQTQHSRGRLSGKTGQ